MVCYYCYRTVLSGAGTGTGAKIRDKIGTGVENSNITTETEYV